MTLVWELELPDSEKLVLLALADCANDEGHCWPGMNALNEEVQQERPHGSTGDQDALREGASHPPRSARQGLQLHRSSDCPVSFGPPKRSRPRSDSPRRERRRPPKRLRANHQEPSNWTTKSRASNDGPRTLQDQERKRAQTRLGQGAVELADEGRR
jgi:hypothetical protein